ncbi:hypothetical protein GCM10022200_02600 [Microbacterium awajiense]|uniref:GGDEF domain-containing protein n=1 Tax=Microbacterium awajiense TaxID=415214 RepID=A0ABP7A2U8_9MICO
MTLDPLSVIVVSALVVNVSGALFVIETLVRRDEGAGRVWAVGFLSAMLASVSYLVWIQDPDAWWAIAIGNAAFVGATGGLWLGCLRFNERRMAVPVLIVLIAVIGEAAIVVAEGAGGGAWAGAVWMFVALLALAGAGAVECMRGALGATRTAWVLAIALGLQSLFYISRTTAFLTSGPDSALFQSAFGAITTSFLTVVLTIVTVVVTSVLRAPRAPLRGYRLPEASDDDLLTTEGMFAVLAALCRRAEARGETVGVVAVAIEDLDQVSTAFGSEAARRVDEVARAGVRRHTPAICPVGAYGDDALLVAVTVDTSAAARRIGGAVYRGLIEDLGGVTGGIIPVIGVGVALSDTVECDPEALVTAAMDAARRASVSVETSVLIADS